LIFLDTNIFIRYFVQDEKEALNSLKVEKLFEKIVSGQVSSFTNTIVITEIIWILEKYYGWEKKEVCENIELILNTPNIKVKEKNIILQAISIYRDIRIDFIDIYNYCYIKAENSTKIYSFDSHFDKISKLYGDIERIAL
jgi:predicted nucleic-acid-binding protein